MRACCEGTQVETPSGKRPWGLLAAAAVLLLFAVAMGLLNLAHSRIRSGLAERRAAAQSAHPHPGNDVAALIDFVRSETHSLRDRNGAVWALGQMGDRHALPVLEEYFTGTECDHERTLCQHELKKAISRLSEPP